MQRMVAWKRLQFRLILVHAASSTGVHSLALTATQHCLTGCVIGEVSGMVIGSSLGWSDGATIALAVVLAFIFGYMLTAWPLLRAKVALGAALTAALASDTISIAIMETIDNLAILLVPGAMKAGIGDPLFWLTLAGGLAVAFPFAYLANRLLIARGFGHARVHEYHQAASSHAGHAQES
jgi:hypothetical protein